MSVDRSKIESRLRKLLAIAADPAATPAEVETANRLVAKLKASMLDNPAIDFQPNFRIYTGYAYSPIIFRSPIVMTTCS